MTRGMSEEAPQASNKSTTRRPSPTTWIIPGAPAVIAADLSARPSCQIHKAAKLWCGSINDMFAGFFFIVVIVVVNVVVAVGVMVLCPIDQPPPGALLGAGKETGEEKTRNNGEALLQLLPLLALAQIPTLSSFDIQTASNERWPDRPVDDGVTAQRKICDLPCNPSDLQ